MLHLYWYIFSILMASIANYLFPATNGTPGLPGKAWIGGITPCYLKWISLGLTLLWIATLILIEHHVQGIWKPKYDWKGIFNEVLILDLLSSCCSYDSRVLGVPDCGSFVDETLSSRRETILKSGFKVVP
jgi:hypothetical protein